MRTKHSAENRSISVLFLSQSSKVEDIAVSQLMLNRNRFDKFATVPGMKFYRDQKYRDINEF